MNNPWLNYTLVRLGLFFGLFLALLALSFNPFFAAIIAATVSFAISLVFLDRQRKQMSAAVAKKLARNKAGSYDDAESDLENQIMDSKGKANDMNPKADEKPKA
jgi:mannitol-specific phosphotransferase system IIBC component